jgi:inosine/xanthosine triphosphate pyrophosphatase family protein
MSQTKTSKPQILFATTNSHKIRLFKIAWQARPELAQNFELLTLNDLPKKDIPHIVEDSGSFREDALIKAKEYAKIYNLPTISQDRGFIFDALNWPGTDSKKVFTLDDTLVMNNKDWDSLKPTYFERAKEILSKIDGLDRSMTIVHGIAACLSNGKYISDELRTKGKASPEVRDSVSGFGGMYDWFFMPKGLGHTLSEFQTKEALDNFCGQKLYPITPKISEFLLGSVKS